MTGICFVLGHAKEDTGLCPRVNQEGACGWTCRPGIELLASDPRRPTQGPKELLEPRGAISHRESLSEEVFEQRPNEGREPAILSCGESAFLAKGTECGVCEGPRAGTNLSHSRLAGRLAWLDPGVQVEDKKEMHFEPTLLL